MNSELVVLGLGQVSIKVSGLPVAKGGGSIAALLLLGIMMPGAAIAALMLLQSAPRRPGPGPGRLWAPANATEATHWAGRPLAGPGGTLALLARPAVHCPQCSLQLASIVAARSSAAGQQHDSDPGAQTNTGAHMPVPRLSVGSPQRPGGLATL